MDIEYKVEDFVKDVLDAATVTIVDKLEPDGLLDIFVERKILGDATHRTIRDTRDQGTTSAKNRGIREIIRRSPQNYINFKEGIASTGQQGLLDELESIEGKLHDSLQETHQCDSITNCHLFQQLKHQQLEVPTPKNKIFEELQKYLLRKYGEENKYWVNPVDDEEVHLSEMYVQPSVKRIREINEHGQMKEVKDLKSQPYKLIYKDIFQSKSGDICKNIYITGDAGTGKSTFCNRLVLNWCSAVQNKPVDTLTAEDQKLLSAFKFLFHINLRDTETTYHVEDMIQKQLLSNVSGSLNISDIMKSEKCLVVLDGLDEWSCPTDVEKCPNINQDIPGRNTANTNCIFITTTRSWKYDVIALRNKDVDKHVDLSGIDEESSKELAQKVLGNLNRDSPTHKTINDFLSKVSAKNLEEFLYVPVLLIQLITLWFFGKDFGKSQLQLYCSMLELMFERSVKNLPEEISECSSTAVATSKKLPECFSTKGNCQKYSKLLHSLAKLAYKTLFNKQKETALVFKSSRLEIFGISPSNIKLCLHCGILSQCKEYGNRTGKYKKFSFLHKKVQECLAALYLVTNKDEDILEEVKQLCNSVETMLEMNQVWLFVAGMDSDMTIYLLEHLGHVVSADEWVKTYRQTVDMFDSYYDDFIVKNESDHLIYDIQRCVSDCVLEGINNGLHYENVCLQDFHMYGHNVRDVGRLLFCSDMSKVKSVYIKTYCIDDAELLAITGQFQQCHSLQGLYLIDVMPSQIPDSTVSALVDNNRDSLTALFMWTRITVTEKLATGICNSISKSLMAFELTNVTLTHKHLEQILHRLSQSPGIRQLVLRELDCTDHGHNECGAKIDCSDMTQLQKLILDNYPMYYVDNISCLSHCVKKVKLEYVSLPVTSLRDLARGLSQTKRKVSVQLHVVTFTKTREEKRAIGIRGFFMRKVKQLKEERELTREECGDLRGFLEGCPGLKLMWCSYNDYKNTWFVEFQTSSDDSECDWF